MDNFTLNIEKFIKKCENRTSNVISKLVLAMHASVIKKSPVDTGRFRNNWYITGDPNDLREVQDRLETYSPGIVAQFAKDGAIYIVNNMPYAMRLEFGYSQQAPAGMARITVMEFQRYLDQAVAAAKAENP